MNILVVAIIFYEFFLNKFKKGGHHGTGIAFKMYANYLITHNILSTSFLNTLILLKKTLLSILPEIAICLSTN